GKLADAAGEGICGCGRGSAGCIGPTDSGGTGNGGKSGIGPASGSGTAPGWPGVTGTPKSRRTASVSLTTAPRVAFPPTPCWGGVGVPRGARGALPRRAGGGGSGRGGPVGAGGGDGEAHHNGAEGAPPLEPRPALPMTLH